MSQHSLDLTSIVSSLPLTCLITPDVAAMANRSDNRHHWVISLSESCNHHLRCQLSSGNGSQLMGLCLTLDVINQLVS